MPIKVIDETRDFLQMAVRRENLMVYARQPGKIGTGLDHWQMHNCATHKEWIRLALFRMAHPEKIAAAMGDPAGRPVLAFLNDNRWLAVCECGGNGVVDPTPGEDWFYCLKCFNAVENGLPRPVLFPEAHDMGEIVDALMKSDDPLWRNWTALEEDRDDPGGQCSNRVPTKEEVTASIARLKAANVAVGLEE